MSDINTDSCILNAGPGAWAFEPLAKRLSAAIGVEIATSPRAFNYLLNCDDAMLPGLRSFTPYSAIHLAADKRLLAAAFAAHNVPTPETRLLNSRDELWSLVAASPPRHWCLKYPTSCGAAGHRLLTPETQIKSDWPLPFVVQEFIHLPAPEVYRLYVAGGEIFGLNARRFPAGAKTSPWVAHVRGARYVHFPPPAPASAIAAARAAFEATGLINSFGCADLLLAPDNRWLILEVGTDGLYNHVDRDLDSPALEHEIERRIAVAFNKAYAALHI